MGDRLKGKIAVVMGAGQTPGETIGNGRASAILYAREGAKVLVVDYQLNSAEDTCQMIAQESGEAVAFQADATKSDDCQKVADVCVQRFGRIDILHNNVGIGDNDGGLNQVTEEAWDRILAVNIKSVIMPCRHVITVMRGQRSGAILNISSIAAVCNVGILAYKTPKAGVNAITNQLALSNAKYGIRVIASCQGSWIRRWQLKAFPRLGGFPRSNEANRSQRGRHRPRRSADLPSLLFRWPCKVIDIRFVAKYCLFVLKVLQAWIDPAQKNPKTIHHHGYGTFVVDGETIKLKSRMR